MKAKWVERKPVLKITLSEREAEILTSLLGGVDTASNSEAAIVLTHLYEELDASVPDRVNTFSNLFKGEVYTK